MRRLKETSRYAVYAFVRMVEFELERQRVRVGVTLLVMALPAGMNGRLDDVYIAYRKYDLIQ